jgi:hypothetical protein
MISVMSLWIMYVFYLLIINIMVNEHVNLKNYIAI